MLPTPPQPPFVSDNSLLTFLPPPSPPADRPSQPLGLSYLCESMVRSELAGEKGGKEETWEGGVVTLDCATWI